MVMEKKFKKIDVEQEVTHIIDTLEKIFSSDPEIEKVLRHNDFPF